MPVCRCCGESKPVEAFNRNRNKEGGVDYSCKKCRAEKRRRLKPRVVEGAGSKGEISDVSFLRLLTARMKARGWLSKRSSGWPYVAHVRSDYLECLPPRWDLYL